MSAADAAVIRDLVHGRRCVFVAGLPGVGKSLLAHRLAAAAEGEGRAVVMLRWDVSRLPFDRPDVLARFPEDAGVTHPVLRFAAGAWAREAVARWDRGAGPGDLLVGEAPLAGNRFVELAKPRDDAAEHLLAGDRTVFVLPVPTREVRARIADARASDIASDRDRHSAPTHLLGDYDPDAYVARYRRALRHRHLRLLPVRAFDAGERPALAARDLVPGADEVDRHLAMFADRAGGELERIAERWDDVSGRLRAMARWTVHRLEASERERMMPGIERRFVSGERTTVAQIWLATGALVPRHTHESEQVSYIVSGALKFTLGDADLVTVRSGEVLVIPSNMPHSAEALEDTYDLDLFAPRRDDWIGGDDAYLRGDR